MFYTKYRPQKFSEISKPNTVAEALMQQVKSNKVAHAYLFIGPRGTGKTTTARILAKALNCLNVDEKGDPCGTCDICKSISTGSFLDLIEIDAASNRGIDDIRDLREKIKLSPSSGKQKVYIVDEVHMLTTEAFNALLKTLEEPPAHSNFILCTTEAHKVPDTIKSRCQVFSFKRASIQQLVTKLKDICKQEKAKVSDEALTQIARASLGGYRDAETLLQQVIEGSLDVESLLGTTDKNSFIEFLDYIQLYDSHSALHKVNNLYEDGVDLYVWTMEFIKYLRDLLFIASEAHEGLLDVTEDQFAQMEEQASKFEPSELVKIIEDFMHAQNAIKGAVIPQLPLELAVISLCDSSGPQSLVGGKKNGVGPTSGGKPSTSSHNKKSSQSSNSKVSASGNSTLDRITQKWAIVVKGTKDYNHSIQALLKAATPLELLEDNTLVLEVAYSFHKERIESPKNRDVVESVLREVMEDPSLSISCTLGEIKSKPKNPKETGELTDLNISVPAGANDVPSDGNILEMFDGGLPL